MNLTVPYRRAWLLASAACALLAATGPVRAQEWPTRPVKIVIGLAPGSASDTVARMMAPRLEALWKQPVIVENKPGAGTTLATEHVVGATDQHTMLLGSLSILLPKFTTKNLRYDPLTDLVPVYRVVDYQLIIATNAATARKAGSLQDVAALSRSAPQGLFFASIGPTSIFSLAMALVNQSLGIRYASVDYNGVPAMNLALLRNDAQLMVNTPSSVKGQIDAGEIRPLAALNAQRYPNLPNVPALPEVGYTGYIPLSWNGIFMPKGTSGALVDRIGRDMLAVLSDPDFRKQVESRVTGTVLRSSPAEFAKEYQQDAVVWKKLFDTLNIKPQ